jgi:hypothetical protein
MLRTRDETKMNFIEFESIYNIENLTFTLIQGSIYSLKPLNFEWSCSFAIAATSYFYPSSRSYGSRYHKKTRAEFSVYYSPTIPKIN